MGGGRGGGPDLELLPAVLGGRALYTPSRRLSPLHSRCFSALQALPEAGVGPLEASPLGVMGSADRQRE